MRACERRHVRAASIQHLVAATAVLLNVVPTFTPPTWALLAYFHLQHSLGIVSLAVVGAVSAASGRMMLAIASRAFGIGFVPRSRRIAGVYRQ